MSETDTQLRELLEKAVGDPPRHIAVPAVRRRLVHSRVTETAAAVVAVVAVGVGGTAVAAHFTGASGVAAGAAAGGLPRYYLQALEPAHRGAASQASDSGDDTPVAPRVKEVLVRSTATGAVTSHIRCPEGTGWWVNQAVAVTNSTFIIGCMNLPAARTPAAEPAQQEVLLRVRLTDAGGVAGLSPVPGGHLANPGYGVISMAAAPDGHEVALLVNATSSRTYIEVLNTVTGQHALWRGAVGWNYWGLSLTSDGRELVFSGAPCRGVGRCTSDASVLAVRPAARGGSLAGARVMARLAQQDVVTISPDGSVLARLELAALAIPSGQKLELGRLDYSVIMICESVKTGDLVGNSYESASRTGEAAVGFLAADPSGQYLIVHAIIGGHDINGWIRENPATFKQDPAQMKGGQLIPLKASGAGIVFEAW